MKGEVKRFSGEKKITAAALLIVMLVSLLTGCKSSIPTIGSSFNVEIAAISESAEGVEAAKGFLLSSSETLSEEFVRQTLQLSPDFDYDLKKEKGGKSFRIIPREDLTDGTVYKFGFDPQNAAAGLEPRSEYQWAFQTPEKFSVRSFLPRDASTGVPVSTGIEISLSQVPDLESFVKNAKIEPSVTGKWSLRDNTVVFVPAKPLEYGQIYSVNIGGQVSNKSGTEVLGKDVHFSFETIAEEKEESSQIFFELTGQNKAFRPTDRPYFSYFQNSNDVLTAEVTIFQYPDRDSYIDALRQQTAVYDWSIARRNKLLPATGLITNSRFSLKGERYNGYWYFFLPDNLPSGFYLAEFDVKGLKRQSLFQVTNLSAYLACNELEALVWVNDLASGRQVAAAQVQAAGSDILAYTDETGTALLKIPPEKAGNNEESIFIITKDNDVLIMNSGKVRYYYQQNNISWLEEQTRRQGYWCYFSIDRPLYRPGDTVNIFGLLTPRDDSFPEIKEVTLQLNGSGSLFNSPLTVTLPVNQGIIDGEYQLPVLTPGYYYLSMYADDIYFSSAYFQVRLYEKPAYKLTLTADKKYVMAGENVTWTTEAAFFEGTPLPQQSICFSGDLIQKECSVLTDQKGQIQFTTETKVVDSGSLYSGQWIYARTNMPETGDIERWQMIFVFNSDVDLVGKVKRSGRSLDYSVTGYDVDPGRIADLSASIEEQAYVPLTGSLELKATLKRHEWDKILTGYTYDPYTKQNVPEYVYSLRQETESTFNWLLPDKNEHTFSLPLEQDNAYTLIVESKDKNGRSIFRSYYIPAVSSKDGRGYPYYWLAADDQKNTANFGEEMTVHIYNEDGPLSAEGKYLFYRSREEILDYTLKEINEYSFVFTRELMPNVNIMGVCFDGSDYYCVNYPFSLQMNLEERKALVKIEKDQDIYKPGDLVKLNLQLTDAAGNPLAGWINLNLLDEALLTVADRHVDMAQYVFWGNTYSFTLRTSVSHTRLFTESMAEGGGEGDGERADFRDTALFKTIKTNARGRASLEFRLPDNLTAWRLIWQAYAPDIWAGSGVDRIEATLPFFIDLRIGDTIIAGDEVVLGLRGAGTAADTSADYISWTVDIPEAGFKRTLNGPFYTWSDLTLPAFPAGEYTLVVNAAYKGYKDGIKRIFKVVDSRQSYEKLEMKMLTAELKPAGSNQEMTILSFSDFNRNQALQGLAKLASQDDLRLEQRLASLIARQILTKKFSWPDWSLSDSEMQALKEEILRYQQNDGGIAILPYSESELEVSALAASCGREYFDQTALKAYFNSVLNSEEADLKERSLALWGSAALGVPVLSEVNALLTESENREGPLAGEIQLNLLLAKTFAGDGARTKNAAEIFVDQWTESLETARRAVIGETGEDVLKATARLAMLSQMLNLPEAKGLYQYVFDQQGVTDYYLLEQLVVLQARLKQETVPAGFTYSLSGKKETVDLLKTPVYILTLTPEQLAEISFEDVKGEISVLSAYRVKGLPAGESLQAGLKIARSYKTAGKAAASLPVQGRSQVTLDYIIPADAPSGWYRIEDYLPAGLRYVSLAENNNSGQNGPWLLQENGNRLVFVIYKKDKEVKGTLNYYVRVAMPGTYRCEAPFMTHSKLANIFAVGSESKLHIR